MSSSIPQNPTSHNVAALLPKLNDADSDIRFMTLNDLHQMLTIGSPTFLIHDYTTCAKVVEGLLQTLNDTNGDVQNQAVKCLGPFVNKAPESILSPTIEKVSMLQTANLIDHTVPATSLRTIVLALPHPAHGVSRMPKVQEASTAISRALIPRLVGKVVLPTNKPVPPPPKGMIQQDLENGTDSNSLDVLAEVARCFGPVLQELEVEALEKTTMMVLEDNNSGSVMRKKAVAALSALAPYMTDSLLSQHVSYTIEKLRQPHLTKQQRKLYISLYASLAKAVPKQFGPYLKTLAPFALSPLSQLEMEQQREAEIEADGERDLETEEVREASLTALESFLHFCPDDMEAYTNDVIDGTVRFLKYDPTLADDDEDDEEMEDEDDEFDADEDFEEETGFDDEDDISWKVRRGSAKVLLALISKLDPNNAVVYSTIAPALMARFKEREESVRNEVLAALASLISRTGAVAVHQDTVHQHELPTNRKRRRGGSDTFTVDLRLRESLLNGYASPSTPPPTDGATIGLAKLNPEIVKASAKLLKTSTTSSKLAIITLLRMMIQAQHGGLSSNVEQVIGPVVEALNTATSGSSSASGNALRTEVLLLFKAMAEHHSSRILQPHMAVIVPVLVKLAKDRYAKVSSEAFVAIESLIMALTPPRSAGGKAQNGQYLTQMYHVIANRSQGQDADAEVKQRAILVLGLLIGRTAGPTGSKLLGQDLRYEGQQILLDRMRNELTRLASVRAFDKAALLSQAKADFKPGLLDEVGLELAAQFRKASRSLRGASLSALRTIATNPASRDSISDAVITDAVQNLTPLLQTEDLHMVGPALVILGEFAKTQPELVVTPAAVQALCAVTTKSIAGSALEALMSCIETIGSSGVSQDLMRALLDQGVDGNIDVTGRVVGALLVASGSKSSVSLEAFVKELQMTADEAKKCLALSVLGEAALRMGPACPLQPTTFTPHFEDASEKVKLAAAVALGRAGAGNVKAYLPQILDAMAQGKQYLLLHSVKELLQHSNAEDDIKPYTQSLWEHIINSGQSEDNKVVSAECIGRLAIIDPAAYLPQLQKFLGNPTPTVRGMVMTALRYVFSDTEDSYNVNLQSSIVPMLSTMLSDQDLDNQRLALSAFNSAFQNKASLVVPQLAELLPYAMQATVVRPELVREVSMGPFKHKVDDGLEIRKSAYETLYGLLENSVSRKRLDVPAFYDRIIEGIADEHEIKIVSCLILSKLVLFAKDESIRRLDALVKNFRAVLSFKPKDNAVKQELEKVSEQNRTIVRVSVVIEKAVGASEASRTWKEYFDWVKKDLPVMYKQADDEVKDLSAL